MRLVSAARILPALIIGTLSASALAGQVDITADKIVRDAEGVATARGKVKVKRENETLAADTVRYDAAHHRLAAKGHVHIRSPRAIIDAESAEVDTVSKRGVMHAATVTLPGGERLSAGKMERLDLSTYKALEPRFTTCPVDDQAWSICASEATLDQKEGVFTAWNARFELAGIPLLYTPYWRHSTRRASGFLMPFVASGKRRGTELALPYYLAPSPDWDATFTPHWMSARGFRPELEVRHASAIGRERIRFEGLYDKVLGRTRGRLRGETSWHLPYGVNFSINADHVSEKDYLADFSSDASEAATRFLQSGGMLSAQNSYGSWRLWALHQRDLTTTDNENTLQTLPGFTSSLALPVLDRLAVLHFDQETTRFDRRRGVDGWRMDLHPYVQIPWEMAGGGLSVTFSGGLRHARYWLADTTLARRPKRTSGEFSMETRAVFERISESGMWRHTIEPVVRYDLVNVSDQTGLPNFDSGFGKLTLSNLLTSNRFSGTDRVESVNRISLLLASRLQTRSDWNTPARTVLSVQVGMAYNIRKLNSDQTLQATPLRPFSNLLGEIRINPTASLSLGANGEYDPGARFLDTATGTLDWLPASGHILHATYAFTDARFGPRAQNLGLSGKLRVGPRWRMLGSWNYDMQLKFSQQASLGLEYRHPCWNISVEAFRINRPSGTSTASNFGAKFLLGLKGLGSFGQCTGH